LAERLERRYALPAVRQLEDEARPRARLLRALAEHDVDLGEEGGRAGRHPTIARMAVQVGAAGIVDRDRVAQVRVRAPGRPQERPALPCESPGAGHVARAV